MSVQQKMKSELLKILYAKPFAGLDHEDPYIHLKKFYEIFGMLGALEAEEESILLRLYPYSLISKANEWYLDQLIWMITNWNALEEKFWNIFFPHKKFIEAKTTILMFSQGITETLCEAWGR